MASTIIETETVQAERMRGGASLREQLGFAEYLRIRESEPGYSLRDHLKSHGGAIET